MVFVALRGVFHERELVFKENSRSAIDLQYIPESSNERILNDTCSPPEDKTHIKPINSSLPLHRSNMVSMKLSFYGFHITSNDDTFINDITRVNLNDPAKYKEAMAVSKVAKLIEAMESEIQSMYDNQFWNLFDHVPGRMIVGCKWIIKNRTTWIERYTHSRHDW